MDIHLTFNHYLGSISTIIIVLGLGFYAMTKVKKSEDFLLGNGNMGVLGVVGILLGTMLGGASTIGTIQMAFSKGISGIWFTFGCASGLVVLSLLLGRISRIHGAQTIPQILYRRYGKMARPVAGIASVFGIFFSIVANNLALSDLLIVLLGTGIYTAFFIIFGLIMIYVLFGGMLGASWVGLFKTVILYIVFIISGYIAYQGLFGASYGISRLPVEMITNFFPEGTGNGVMSYFSTIVGVASTQTYLQAYYPAKGLKTARKGYLIASVMILPIGIISVLIGLYMKAFHPHITSNQVMPLFLSEYLPAEIGGVGFAILVLAGLGTASGLMMGMTTMIVKDLYKVLRPNAMEKTMLFMSRLVIITIGIISTFFAIAQYGSQILTWNYLSLGLRGAGVFFPLLGALLMPRQFLSPWIVKGMFLSTLIVLILQFSTDLGMKSLGYGLFTSLIFMIIGWLGRKKGELR